MDDIVILVILPLHFYLLIVAIRGSSGNFSSPYGTTNRAESRLENSGCSTLTRSATESFLISPGMLDKERKEAKSKDESLKKLEESLHNLTSKANGQEHVNKTQQDKIKELKI
ncbi:hypothetical protein T459_23541 [Capsicum annuum]|uniref:Uncharacterized protein n=1 Tax=Capsicum annuum TaxID=4072 RepID=A0A2G2YSN4_CAPAN|nr:hypothetical protein T459_23541 [Capsicum annuum]